MNDIGPVAITVVRSEEARFWLIYMLSALCVVTSVASVALQATIGAYRKVAKIEIPYR